VILTQRPCLFVPCPVRQALRSKTKLESDTGEVRIARNDMNKGIIQETNITSNQPKYRWPKMSFRALVCRHAKVSLTQHLLFILLKKSSTLFSKCECVKIFCTCVSKLYNWILLHISYYDWKEQLHVKHINYLFQDKFLNISYLQTSLQVIVVDFTNSRLWDWCNKYAESYYINSMKILTWNTISAPACW